MEEGWKENPRASNTQARITDAVRLYSNTFALHVWQWARALLSYASNAEAHLRKVVLGLRPDKDLSDHERRKHKHASKIISQLRTGRLVYVLLMFVAVGLLAFVSHDSSLHQVETDFERTMLIQANISRMEAATLNRNIKLAEEANRLVESEDDNSGVQDEILEEIESWPEESAHIKSLRSRAAAGALKVGLLNLKITDDLGQWQFLAGKRPVALPMRKVAANVAWINLFPEWIDEQGTYGNPKCPVYPMPEIPSVPYVPPTVQFDVVIAQAPCNEPSTLQEGWRHPAILQVLVGAVNLANLAAQAGHESINVLIFSKCRPLVNLFPCKELVEHRNEGWLYHMNVEQLKKRASLPIGSCELSVQLDNKFYVRDHASEMRDKSSGREAYATILHSGEDYVCGAIATAQSIRATGSTRDLVVLVDSTISPASRRGLEEAGWKVRDHVRITKESRVGKPKDFSLLRLWQLDYDKVIYVESDIIVLRNIDNLFKLPEVAASGTTQSMFDPGLMVIEPSNCTFQVLMEEMERIAAEVINDWEFFNRVFPWWHRVPRYMNTLKNFWNRDKKLVDFVSRLFSADPAELYAIHYIRGQKPWKCFRDYDCNWNTNQQYASDEAHAQWFKVYDKMPENLQKYCALSAGTKAKLEYDRRSAQLEDTPDKHWAVNITDPRLNICQGSRCDLKLCEANHCDYDAMMRRANPSTKATTVANSSKTQLAASQSVNSLKAANATVASVSQSVNSLKAANATVASVSQSVNSLKAVNATVASVKRL